MPYQKYSIKCPCGSGREAEFCHGKAEAEDNNLGRARHLISYVQNHQSEVEIARTFGSASYLACRNSFDPMIRMTREMEAMSIRSGGNGHESISLGADDLVAPDYLPPRDVIAYMAKAIDLSDSDGQLIIGEGLYRLSVPRWGRAAGGGGRMVAESRFYGAASSILVDGVRAREARFNSEIAFSLIDHKFLFVRCIMFLHHDLYAHTAA